MLAYNEEIKENEPNYIPNSGVEIKEKYNCILLLQMMKFSILNVKQQNVFHRFMCNIVINRITIICAYIIKLLEQALSLFTHFWNP